MSNIELAYVEDNVLTKIIVATTSHSASIASDSWVDITSQPSASVTWDYDPSTGLFSDHGGTVPTTENLLILEREWRNQELTKTDDMVPLTDLPDYDSWIGYRQKLRDYPNTANYGIERPVPDHLTGSVAKGMDGFLVTAGSGSV